MSVFLLQSPATALGTVTFLWMFLSVAFSNVALSGFHDKRFASYTQLCRVWSCNAFPSFHQAQGTEGNRVKRYADLGAEINLKSCTVFFFFSIKYIQDLSRAWIPKRCHSPNVPNIRAKVRIQRLSLGPSQEWQGPKWLRHDLLPSSRKLASAVEPGFKPRPSIRSTVLTNCT